jgi:hypothetical protein
METVAMELPPFTIECKGQFFDWQDAEDSRNAFQPSWNSPPTFSTTVRYATMLNENEY